MTYREMEKERYEDGDTIKAEMAGRIHIEKGRLRQEVSEREKEREVLNVGKGGHRCSFEQ